MNTVIIDYASQVMNRSCSRGSRSSSQRCSAARLSSTGILAKAWTKWSSPRWLYVLCWGKELYQRKACKGSVIVCFDYFLVRNYDETLNNPRHFKWILISGWEQHERLDLWVPAIPGGKTLLYPQPSVSISPMLPCYIKPFSQATIDDDDCFDAEEEDQDQD